MCLQLLEIVNEDLFCSLLEVIFDFCYELIQLVWLIDWNWFDEVFGVYYYDWKGWCGLWICLMMGLYFLKYMKGFLDEEFCVIWVENLYFQVFCGEMYFQYWVFFDCFLLICWCQCIDVDVLEMLLVEMILVVVKIEVVSDWQLEWIIVDMIV